MSGSGTMRSSPTGPIPSTGCSWSREFIASIASVTPIPPRRRCLQPASAVAFAHSAVVPAPQEADEPDVVLARGADDVDGLHGGKIGELGGWPS